MQRSIVREKDCSSRSSYLINRVFRQLSGISAPLIGNVALQSGRILSPARNTNTVTSFGGKRISSYSNLLLDEFSNPSTRVFRNSNSTFSRVRLEEILKWNHRYIFFSWNFTWMNRAVFPYNKEEVSMAATSYKVHEERGANAFGCKLIGIR